MAAAKTVKTTNVCGGCTACCDLFPVRALAKPPNTKCQHCDAGCLIHETRPQECRDFDCMWLQSTAPIEIRPDRCGIIFEKLSDRLIYGSVLQPITAEGARQAHAFVGQGFSVVLAKNTGGAPRLLLNPKHTKESVDQEFRQHLEDRYGNLRH